MESQNQTDGRGEEKQNTYNIKQNHDLFLKNQDNKHNKKGSNPNAANETRSGIRNKFHVKTFPV